jgi:hypothetical protein
VSGFTVRLYLDGGEDIGTFSTAVPDWKIGDVFYNRDRVEFRILYIVTDLGGDEFAGAFVVSPIALCE